MPDLFHSLQGYDLGHLRILASMWGLELHSTDAQDAAHELALGLRDERLRREVIGALPDEAKQALSELRGAGGRTAWARFARKFGDVREMGAARRDREKPYLDPASTSEVLFYRGLLARAFFDTDSGPQEFAYIPDELLVHLRPSTSMNARFAGQSLGRRATPAERSHVLPGSDRILDDATTYLAALRTGLTPAQDPVLRGLIEAAGLIKAGGLQANAVKSFLESTRAESMRLLIDAWRGSADFNELKLVPGLMCEGEWHNEPLTTRRFLLDLIGGIPAGQW